MLQAMGVLPTHPSARAMRDRDYLWCLANLVLDREEELERLCPECRARAERELCPCCGLPQAAAAEAGGNAAFDRARYEQLKGGTEQ